jgi:hypothetical protein
MFYGYSEGLILPLQLVVAELEGSINVFHSCKKHSECALSYTLWDSGVLFVRCTQCELVLCSKKSLTDPRVELIDGLAWFDESCQ